MIQSKIIVLAFMLAVTASFAYAAARESPTSLPGALADVPINARTDGQIKNGGLTVNSGSVPYNIGLYVVNGNAIFGAILSELTTAQQSMKLFSKWKIGATHYCDTNGQNCIDPAAGQNGVPSGAIIAVTGECPAGGWIVYAPLNGRIPRIVTSASNSGGQTGGADSHRHSMTVYGGTECKGGNQVRNARYTGWASNMPPTVNVMYCQKI